MYVLNFRVLQAPLPPVVRLERAVPQGRYHQGLERQPLGLPATASVTANPCGQIMTIEADANHPALALAIACLKARGLT